MDKIDVSDISAIDVQFQPIIAGAAALATNKFFQVCFKPEDEGAGGDEPAFDFAEPPSALTMDSGAALLANSMRAEREREPSGKFKAAEKPAVSDDPENKVVDLKTGKPPAEAKVEDDPAKAAADDDEDLEFEFPPEAEGKDPTRRKLSELVEGYEKAAKLETELETLRSESAHVPAEYKTAVLETVQARGQYLKGLEFVSKLFNPQPPSTAMLDESHPSYDPAAYRMAYQQFEQTKAAIADIAKQHETLTKEQTEQNAALMKAHLAGEREALYKAWPEAKSPETVKKVTEVLRKDYGFTPEEIAATTDHRMFLVIRDALEFRASKAKQAEAVKVVRQKPKLVKGAARITTDSKAAGRSQAMAKLSQTGSIHDAVKAVKGLI